MSSGHIRSPSVHAFFELEDFEGDQKVHFDLTWVLFLPRHGSRISRKTVDAQIPSPLFRVIFTTHVRKPVRDLRKLEMLWYRVVSVPRQKTKPWSTARQAPPLPVSRTTKGAPTSAGCFALLFYHTKVALTACGFPSLSHIIVRLRCQSFRKILVDLEYSSGAERGDVACVVAWVGMRSWHQDVSYASALGPFWFKCFLSMFLRS